MAVYFHNASLQPGVEMGIGDFHAVGRGLHCDGTGIPSRGEYTSSRSVPQETEQGMMGHLASMQTLPTRASSETQGQLVGAGKSLNRREKNSGAEKSRTRIRAPGDKVFNGPVPNGRCYSGF